MKRFICALSLCLAFTACSTPPPATTAEPVAPALAPEAPPPAASGCTLTNETAQTVELMDSAIDRKIGALEAGASASHSGSFTAVAGEAKFTGWCSEGGAVRLVLQEGKLVGLAKDGSIAQEGEEH